MKRLFFLLVLILLVGCTPPAAVPPAPAATLPVTAVSDDQVNAVAHQLYCPICQNISLDVCPTAACARWRDLIRQKLAVGWSIPQIKDYFASQYGDQVLPEPPMQGFNWLAYVLPLLVFLAALATAWGFVRRPRQRKMDAPGAAVTAQDDAYLSQIEEDLRRRDRE
jgi:cytochrome c-type biogenesis protein CcmH